jgi:hypothetical protein
LWSLDGGDPEIWRRGERDGDRGTRSNVVIFRCSFVDPVVRVGLHEQVTSAAEALRKRGGEASGVALAGAQGARTVHAARTAAVSRGKPRASSGSDGASLDVLPGWGLNQLRGFDARGRPVERASVGGFGVLEDLALEVADDHAI